jgi:predicted MFS family arabinose efflux permease
MDGNTPPMASANVGRLALRFVLIIGIVNLFADMTYEGARGIVGPFLGSLGASAAIVGFVAGFGELMGYSLRSVTGYLGDRTHKYWFIIFVGYIANMLAVPALALAGNWPVAAVLVVLERTGRAFRKPNVEALLSHAGQSLGSGWVFGLNEALDQSGATLGPLIAALILYLKAGYHPAFAVLLIPALLCLGVLVVARVSYPRPHELERRTAQLPHVKGFSRVYWTYCIAGMLIAAGFADFSLMAFHFAKSGIVAADTIPVFYAIAMAAGALAALVFGRLYDRLGGPILLLAFALPILFAPLVFWGGFAAGLLGTIIWGVGMGAQDSLLKAVLVGTVGPEKRSTAFGVFDTGFGVAWFAGSAAMGVLYDVSITSLILFSVLAQSAALPFLLLARRRQRRP